MRSLDSWTINEHDIATQKRIFNYQAKKAVSNELSIARLLPGKATETEFSG